MGPDFAQDDVGGDGTSRGQQPAPVPPLQKRTERFPVRNDGPTPFPFRRIQPVGVGAGRMAVDREVKIG